MRKKIKFFYTNYETDEGIDNPIEMSLEEIISIFLELVDGEGNFFGFTDNDNNCIQFINEENKWLLDIPNPPNFNNLQTYLNDKECISLIEKFISEDKISKKLDLKLHEVKTIDETLNDVLYREQKKK